jgi:hypothetical protein
MKKILLGETSVVEKTSDGKKVPVHLKIFYRSPDTGVFEDLEKRTLKSKKCIGVRVEVGLDQKGSFTTSGFLFYDEHDPFESLKSEREVMQDAVVGTGNGICLELGNGNGDVRFISLPKDFCRQVIEKQAELTSAYVDHVDRLIRDNFKDVEYFLIIRTSGVKLEDGEMKNVNFFTCIPVMEWSEDRKKTLIEKVILDAIREEVEGADRWRLGDVFGVYQYLYGKYISEAVRMIYQVHPELLTIRAVKGSKDEFLVIKEEMRVFLDYFREVCEQKIKEVESKQARSEFERMREKILPSVASGKRGKTFKVSQLVNRSV